MNLPTIKELKLMDKLDAVDCLSESIETIKNRIRYSKNGEKRYLELCLFNLLLVQDEFLSIQNMDEV